MRSLDGLNVPVNKSFFSTLDMSNSTGKHLASNRAMTLESEAMKGPGGMLVLKMVDLYFSTRDLKKSSRPWL